MAQVGQLTPSGGRAQNLTEYTGPIRRVSVTTTFTPNHIGAWVWESSTANANDVRAGLYDATSGELVAQSNVLTTPIGNVGTAELHTFAFASQPTLPAGDYLLVIYGTQRDGQVTCNGQNGPGGEPQSFWVDPPTWPSLPDPILPYIDDETSRLWDLYLDYTEGGEPEPEVPVISSLSDTTLTHGQVGVVITLTGGSASGNTVLISPTDDVEDVDAVAQTITAESATEITFTADLDSFDFGATLYLFVINGDSESNADGEAVTRIIGSATLSATFIGQDDQARPNLTDIKISIWRGGTISGAPDQQITAETTDESGLFETEIEVGALEYGDKPFVVVEVGSPPTIWTCGLKDVTYE